MLLSHTLKLFMCTCVVYACVCLCTFAWHRVHMCTCANMQVEDQSWGLEQYSAPPLLDSQRQGLQIKPRAPIRLAFLIILPWAGHHVHSVFVLVAGPEF